MPNGDKTGPQGLGPMTGNKQGYCTGSNNPGFFRNQVEKGNLRSGKRFGGGNGSNKRRCLFNARNFSQKEILDNELEVLKDRTEFLESEIKKFD